MTDCIPTPDWIETLPKIRGRYSFDYDLSKVTWFRVGGPADVVFKPADIEDLQHFLKNKPSDVPIIPLGVGSNVLIRDGGVRGVVIRLGRSFVSISTHEHCIVKAGAGALDVNVAQVACNASISGLSFLRGIPGTIGGALRMNAGAYGTEVKDVLQYAKAVDLNGALHTLSPEEMQFSYRHCGIPEGWIFIEATFQGSPGNHEEIQQQMNEIQQQRESSQPIRTRTGGSTFANPEGQKAWELIDQAGCRGLEKGGAQVSQQHCNFLINKGNATADDLESLGDEVKSRVLATSGIDLKWEIRKLGNRQKK